jgi:hypothetical protein
MFLDTLGSFLHSPWMLLGLPVLLIPPIIHLLNRRRYDVVDWGAMQFLQVSEVKRRRLMIEELLLMALRMGLLGVLVFALAGPFFSSDLSARLGARANRDVVLVIDGSYSMGATDELGKGSPHERAKEWALAFLDELTPGDGVAVLQAKQQVVAVVGELSRDLARVRKKIRELPPPAGGCDWPGALKQAHAILSASPRAEREVVLLNDGQRFGWADPDTLLRWGFLRAELGYDRPEPPDDQPRPRLWAVNLAAGRPAAPPNWALAPLRGNRPVVPAKREVTFRTELLLHGQKEYSAPHRLRLEVDGKPVKDLPPPRAAKIENGKVPFSFRHRFDTPGSHLVRLTLEPDPPPHDRPRGYPVKDRVPGDNRRAFAVEVVSALRVLLVDGDDSAAVPPERGTDFLKAALAPKGDPAPAVQARVASLREFTPEMLGGEQRPRVLVLSNVPRLEPAQDEAVGQFLADGGGVLVTLGHRAEADLYNEQLYRGGEGWLPARLDGVEGDEGRLRDAARPDPGSFNHPALDLFRKPVAGGLGEARFPRWWKLTTPGRHAPGVVVGQLRTPGERYPFLVERAYRAGRVLLCPVPLDNSWGTNLPDLLAFVPLAHELVYYLAGARSAEFNLQPGQPLRYRLARADADLGKFTLRTPLGEVRPLSPSATERGTFAAQLVRQERGAVLVHDGMRETGVYRLGTPEGATVYYVVQPDARESDLTPCTEEERRAVADVIPLRYQDERAEIARAWVHERHRQELWLYLLLGLIGLLCLEVWMTRRMVKARA